MDDLDRDLIRILRTDARTPAAAIAKQLRVSRGTVQNRIARLIRVGAILGFTLRMPPASEPQRVRAIMTLAIEGERTAAVLASLRGVPEVTAAHSTNGRWDLVLDLNAESLPAFSQALDHIRQIKGIATSETSLLLATRAF